MALEYSGQIFEKYSNFMKICPVGAEFHVDGRTDMTKLIVAFRDFANAHKNWWWEYLNCVLAVELQVSFDRYLGNSELSIMLRNVYIVMFFFGLRSYLTRHSVPVIMKTHGGRKFASTL
jgi:hypothetical protein